jgi:2-isopropylmalate synthase
VTLDIFDWNSRSGALALAGRTFELLDETLRDGLQSPSVVDPCLGDKLEIVHMMAQLGIRAVKAGMPSSSARAAADALAMVREIRDNRLPLAPCCAARTTPADIQPVIEIAQQTGVAVEIYTFIGASALRMSVEDWALTDLLGHLERSTRFAEAHGLPVCLVTEDTTRAHPQVLEPLFRRALDLGVCRFCLCDTAGYATPAGVAELFAWTQALVRASGGQAKLDFHGHNDRGLAVVNTLQAIACGADRVHGTALGIGERVGNAALDLVIVNLALAGAWDHDLSDLVRYCERVAQACQVTIPASYPVLGRDAFRTGTGVHAAAILKARRKGNLELADGIYSSVKASLFGRMQEIEIGPMSGLSNVICWLEHHGVACDTELARAIMARAKAARGVLDDEQIWSIIRERRVAVAT